MIRIALTNEEAKDLFYLNPPKWAGTWTGIDECGDKETEIEWIYNNMGCGRTSWGVTWGELPDRVYDMAFKLKQQFYPNNKVYFIFTGQKEVYPSRFVIIMEKGATIK